ncbi:hypothetical protein AVEN_94057-1, partial [Araneus ventricosus]
MLTEGDQWSWIKIEDARGKMHLDVITDCPRPVLYRIGRLRNGSKLFVRVEMSLLIFTTHPGSTTCRTILYNIVRYYIILYHIVQYDTILRILFNIVEYYTISLCFWGRLAVHSSTSDWYLEWSAFNRPSKDYLGIIRRSWSQSSNSVAHTEEMTNVRALSSTNNTLPMVSYRFMTFGKRHNTLLVIILKE